MKNQPNKLSRRETMKVLGAAAGASLLANLPSKWSTPEVTGGALPAHAQASSLYSFTSCDQKYPTGPTNMTGSLYSFITPATAGINIQAAIQSNSNVTVNVDPTNVYQTDNNGRAAITSFDFDLPAIAFEIVIRWTFVDPTDGNDYCDTVITNS